MNTTTKTNCLFLRDLTDNTKLISLLNKIELVLGYQIKALPMSKDHQLRAECSVEMKDEKFHLLYIKEKPVSDDLICHELMHLALVITGFPAFIMPFKLSEYSRNELLGFIGNLSLHIQVWKLTEQYGFSESNRYEKSTSTLLTAWIKEKKFSKLPDPYFEIIQASIYLASGFLCPCAKETKTYLREIAMENYPQSLALADSICLAYEKALPLNPKSICAATFEVLELIKCPKELLTPIYFLEIHQDFFGTVFDHKEQH